MAILFYHKNLVGHDIMIAVLQFYNKTRVNFQHTLNILLSLFPRFTYAVPILKSMARSKVIAA